MAIGIGTNQPAIISDPNYDPFKYAFSSSAGPTPTPIPGAPVAIGPVPTPIPPQGKAVTVQYPGGSTFTTPNPIPYSQTPQGAEQQRNYDVNANVSDVNQGNLLSKFPGYAGWDPAAAWADYLKTGGAGKGGGGGSSSSASTSPPPVPTYNINGKPITAPTGEEALKNAGYTNTDYAKYADQYTVPQEFLNAINSGYNAQNEFLSGQENALKAAQDAFNATIESDYAANLAQGTASKEKAKGTLAQNTVQAQQRKQDALNSAKQLYQQLQQGYRQRFGGASSAGEAAQTLLGQEQQRQAGGIGRDFLNTQANIEAQAADVENQYQATIQQLEQNKQAAKRDVLLNVQSQLTAIGNNRVMAEQAKQQAIMQALQEARDKNFQIDQANRAYQQNLDLMKQQALLNSASASSSMTNAIGGNTAAAQQALSQFAAKTNNVSSALGQGNRPVSISTLQSQPSITTATGFIAPQSIGGKGYDQYGNPL